MLANIFKARQQDNKKGAIAAGLCLKESQNDFSVSLLVCVSSTFDTASLGGASAMVTSIVVVILSYINVGYTARSNRSEYEQKVKSTKSRGMPLATDPTQRYRSRRLSTRNM